MKFRGKRFCVKDRGDPTVRMVSSDIQLRSNHILFFVVVVVIFGLLFAHLTQIFNNYKITHRNSFGSSVPTLGLHGVDERRS
jgi:hypothetical protein